MLTQKWLLLTASAATLVALTGCAVAPVSLTAEEVSLAAKDVLTRVAADQEPVTTSIDLYEAMARSLKYNLDYRVETMEATLRNRELDVANANMLPSLVAGSGYAARNNDNASNSVNILTGVQSLSNSTSQERRTVSADTAFSWHVLDFGLSYVRAHQAADKHLIGEEMRRKVANRLIEDVRTAYWRAVSADRLLSRLSALEGRVKKAQANSRTINDDRRTSPVTAATYERELIEIKRTVQELERELSIARTQLSSLMNLKPGARFALAHGNIDRRPPELTMSVPSMVQTALEQRPELREVWYRQRINGHEANAALLELLPGLQLYAGPNYDTNDFLYNNNWLSWGAKASWNVIRVFQYPRKRDLIETQDQVLNERGLAVAMAIMTQVHVSRVRFKHLGEELRTATEYLEVQHRLLGLMRAEAAANRTGEQALIREEMNTLLAEVRRDITHASLQNAYANVHASMGQDLLGEDLDTRQTVKTLAITLRQTWAKRDDAAMNRWQTAAIKR
jgi:outer membrane protein TolC